MNFIEELYYGNLNPSEKRYDRDSQYAKALETFCKNEKIRDKMQDNWNNIVNIDKDYLYKFKKTEITLSKLITKDAFPTFDSFKKFVAEAKTNSLNYRFSTLQENTPNLNELHPKWVDEELLPICKVVPVLECLNAAEYEGYIIKIMHYHNKDAYVEFPPYPKLYPNGNLSTTWKHDNMEIDYKSKLNELLEKSK